MDRPQPVRWSPRALQARGLTVGAGVLALSEVDLRVPDGAIVGVVGTKGSGAGTLLDCLEGFVRPDAGTVWYREMDVTVLPVHRRAALGLARVSPAALDRHQTVQGHVLAALHVFAGADVRRRAARALALVGLEDVADLPIARLTRQLRCRVALAAAVAAGVDVALVDRPLLGVELAHADELAGLLRALRRDCGLTMVIHDEHVPFVLEVADDVYCLHHGRVVTHGPPAQVRRDPAVVSAFLGVA